MSSSRVPKEARVIPLRPAPSGPAPAAREPLWRHVVGGVLRRERLDQERTLKDVADAARISMPYLSEIERGRKEPSSEVLAAAAHALGLELVDLLTLVQGELTRTRPAARPHRPTTGVRDAARALSGLSAPHRTAPPRSEVRLAA
ncbi:helix-turn-helix transcriptional regulator [Streptomyces sp. CAU 1734]|uniref:helix-turn-helix domain-containing protein n=1 Tax=Streptomyces sp. CAU 1734 TaxID=3140360 RepID=UPI0032616E01